MIGERVAVARPADANMGPIRARPPAAVAAMRRMHDGGASPAAIAEAYGVSIRTVYRYLDPTLEYFEVQVGAWVADFATRPGSPPWRVGAWRSRIARGGR